MCGFRGAGHEQAYHSNSVCDLPGDFQIDRSYHQQSATFAGGGAESNLSVADIPHGIHISVSGNTYWSIVQPIGMVILDQEGPVVRRIYSTPILRPQPPPGAGCSVHVDVYARRKAVAPSKTDQ